MESRFSPVAYGVDDLTLGFDMTGSRSIGILNARAGVETRRGKMLGERGSWGGWFNLLGRSVSFWKADTCRLYVQTKLAPAGELCAPTSVQAEVRGLIERMAVVGLESFEHPWVTRMDVAVDAVCDPHDGKMLLDALESVRLPNGWRTTSAGTPRSTVYFRARVSERVEARAYCRNLKTRSGEPFGRIRLEAQRRFDPRACPLALVTPEFIASLWESRFAGLAATVRRLGREQQAVDLAARVTRGELTEQQAERVHLFLDLERLGVAASCYSKSRYSARKRELTALGFSPADTGPDEAEYELGQLLAPYSEVVRLGLVA